MVSYDSTLAADYTVTATPNCSLSPVGRSVFFILITAVSVAIAVGFTMAGAWPVLPFASVELLALWLAFRHVRCHQHDFERLIVAGDKVTMEHCERDHTSRFEFNRYWARVVLDCSAFGSDCYLAVASHGREVAFGRFMSDEERITVARQLKSFLKG